jgi:hypothetical protein
MARLFLDFPLHPSHWISGLGIRSVGHPASRYFRTRCRPHAPPPDCFRISWLHRLVFVWTTFNRSCHPSLLASRPVTSSCSSDLANACLVRHLGPGYSPQAEDYMPSFHCLGCPTLRQWVCFFRGLSLPSLPRRYTAKGAYDLLTSLHYHDGCHQPANVCSSGCRRVVCILPAILGIPLYASITLRLSPPQPLRPKPSSNIHAFPVPSPSSDANKPGFCVKEAQALAPSSCTVCDLSPTCSGVGSSSSIR